MFIALYVIGYFLSVWYYYWVDVNKMKGEEPGATFFIIAILWPIMTPSVWFTDHKSDWGLDKKIRSLVKKK